MISKNALLGATSLTPHLGAIVMAVTIEDLEAQQQELLAASQALVDAADGEERDLTDEELDTIEANRVKVEALGKQISARRAATPVAQGQGRRTQPEPQNRGEPAAGGRRTVPASPRDSGRHNFQSLGEFAIAARAHKLGDFENEGVKKLQNAATTYGNEGAGTDGAFLIPPDFAAAIWKKVEAEENLMARCVELTPEGNSMTIPKDETTPWGTAGIQAYWEPEAAAISQTKAAFESSTLRLFKLTALAPVTDEMLEDARGFESWLMAKVPGIMSHKINSAIVSGTIHDGLLTGPVEYRAAKPKADLVNRVKLRFVASDREYQQVDGPVLTRSDLVTSDGELLEATLDLPFTMDDGNVPRAQRLQKAFLDNARLGRQLSVTCDVALLADCNDELVGAAVVFDSDLFAQANGTYLCLDWGFTDNFASILLTLAEYDDTIETDFIAATDEQAFDLASLDLT